MQKQGLLGLPIDQTNDGQPITPPLVSRQLYDHLVLDKVTFHLARWIASLDSQEALNWALSEGGVLHAELRRQVRCHLYDTEAKLPLAFRKIWRVLAEDGYAHALSEMYQSHNPTYAIHPRLAPEAAFAIRTLLNRLRPIPVFKVKSPYFPIGQNPRSEVPADWYEIEIELVGIGGDHDIESFRERADDWEGTLATIADDLTTRLCEAMDWLCELGLATTGEEYPSISPHERNQHAPTWTQLIALTRDSYDALISTGDNNVAARLVRRWRSLPYPVFRRLALYAATGGCNA